MGLGNKVEQDDFKATMKQFAKGMDIVAREIDNTVKLR